MSDVDYVRVHEAMRLVGERLEAERLQRIAARNAAHIAAGGSICTALAYPLKTQCTRPAVMRTIAGGHRCEYHTPARLAGRPEVTPSCVKPLRCYCASCAPTTDDEPHASELQQRVDAWRQSARDEIRALASTSRPFGPRELAALLPVKLAGRDARVWLLKLLDELVLSGALVRLSEASWRARRDDESVQHVDVEVPRVEYVERENRYQ